ncbi:exopolyphosphatase, partial [Thioclava sp. BHET1]
LNPKGRERALAALRRFAVIADAMGISPVTAVATAAVREAVDGPEFQAEVLRETGLKLWIIDGREEARLSAQGVLLGWPEAEGLVCDIGGSSMELAVIGNGRIGKRVTSPLGPFRLQQIEGGAAARQKHLIGIIKDLKEQIGQRHNRLYLVGGS